jgi:transcriptional regulator with XRE-family HTH domain
MALRATQSDGQSVEGKPEWPSAAARILRARLSAGLTDIELARQLKTSVASYDDLDRYDDEAFSVLSLEQLLALGKGLNIDPRVLLLGEEASRAPSAITFRDISAHLAHRIAREGQTVEEFSNRIGWNVESVLKNPEALRAFNVEALHVICSALELDWVAALPTDD